MTEHDPELPPSQPQTNMQDLHDADLENQNDKIPHYPRFLVVQAQDAEVDLRKLKPLVLEKTIQGMTGKSVQPKWMGRVLQVETTCEAYSTNLLKMTKIGETPVRVSPHRSLL